MARRAGRAKAAGTRNHWSVEEARRMLAAWERSGLTVAAFCRERGLRPKRLYWWRRRLSQWSEEAPSARQALGDGGAGAGLVEAVVVPSTSPRSTALTLDLRSGDRIEVVVPAQVDAGWLVVLARGLSTSAEASGR